MIKINLMPRCACGCRQLIKIKHHHKWYGIPEYIRGHNINEGNKGQKLSEDHKRKIGESSKGRIHSKETKRKISEGNKGENHRNWKGGGNDYWHAKARELFGKACCENCGMTLKEHLDEYNKRFDMHCTSIPKDYNIMETDNWQTLCTSCHTKLENELRD